MFILCSTEMAQIIHFIALAFVIISDCIILIMDNLKNTRNYVGQ